MIDERGRATGGAEGAGCGAPSFVLVDCAGIQPDKIAGCESGEEAEYDPDGIVLRYASVLFAGKREIAT